MPILLGMVMWSMFSRCRSVARTPDSSSSSAMEPMHTTSSPSSLTHSGMGVPQYRVRDTAQSRASLSQLWNRFVLTNSGTQ